MDPITGCSQSTFILFLFPRTTIKTLPIFGSYTVLLKHTHTRPQKQLTAATCSHTERAILLNTILSRILHQFLGGGGRSDVKLEEFEKLRILVLISCFLLQSGLFAPSGFWSEHGFDELLCEFLPYKSQSDMKSNFGIISQSGLPLMMPNNEAQSILQSLISNNSPSQREGYVGASSGDLPAAIVMAQSTVNSATENFICGPDVGMNSFISDANLLVSNSFHLQRSGNANIEPLCNLPSPPMLFESRGNSVMPGFSAAHEEESTGHEVKRQKLQHSTGPALSSKSQEHQVSPPTSIREDPGDLLQTAKMPRPDVNQEALLQQEIYQQLLLRQDLMQVQNLNMQLKTFIQHQRQHQLEQQILQSIPQLKLLQGLQPEDQLRHHLQQQGSPQVSSLSSPPIGICSRRIMQYLYHLTNRPQDNSIAYWRKFVSEYYAPAAKKRWCLSLYDNFGNQARGVFSHTAKGAWTCDVCGSKLGKGFEANFEILPRLFQINFGGDLVDEILFLEMPQECRFPSGLMMVEYGKAVLESVFEHGRVVREGKLRVFFRQDLKILSWEFCAWQHEEFLVRRQIFSQINQLVESAQKCQTLDTVSAEDFQSNCNKCATSGCQLARTIESPLVNDLGFPKRYVRCLQIAEVFNSIGHLMALSFQNKMGPLECLKYCSQESMPNIQMKVRREQRGTAGEPANGSMYVKANFRPGNRSVDSHFVNDGALSAAREVGMPLPSSGHTVESQTSVNPTGRMIKQEMPCLADQTSHTQVTSRMLVPQSSNSGQLESGTASTLSKGSNVKSGGCSKNLEQHLVTKMLQEMMTSSREKSMGSSNVRKGPAGSSLDVNSSMGSSAQNRNLSTNGRGSAEVLKVASCRVPSSVPSKLTIKKEPHVREF